VDLPQFHEKVRPFVSISGYGDHREKIDPCLEKELATPVRIRPSIIFLTHASAGMEQSTRYNQHVFHDITPL
jgi:hypothetical protein